MTTFKEGAAARLMSSRVRPEPAERRRLPTRRLKLRRRVTPMAALKNAVTPAEVVTAMNRKAAEFAQACLLELGVRASVGATDVVRRALLQDFIEVYNAALSRTMKLPEDARAIEALVV